MPTTSWMNEIQYPKDRCKRCGGLGWGVGFYEDAGGSPKYPFYCLGCGKRTQGFAQRKAVEKSGISVKHMFPSTLPFLCEKCGAEGAQEHHWAPIHLFGDQADAWPKSFLCPRCHKVWHDRVTPNMGKA